MSRNIEAVRHGAQELAVKSGLIATAALTALSQGSYASGEGKPVDLQSPSVIQNYTPPIDRSNFLYSVRALGVTRGDSPLSIEINSPADGSQVKNGIVKIQGTAKDENDDVLDFDLNIDGEAVTDDGMLCSLLTTDRVAPYSPGSEMSCQISTPLLDGMHTASVTARNSRGEIKTDVNEFEVVDSRLAFISQGTKIANPDAFNTFYADTISTNDDFKILYQKIHGEDAEVPTFDEATQRGFLVAENSTDPAFKLISIAVNEKGSVDIALSEQHPGDTQHFDSIGRKTYIIGIVNDTNPNIRIARKQE